MMIKTAINKLNTRLHAVPFGQGNKLARRAGIDESTLRKLKGKNLNTKTIRTLTRIEHALDEIEREDAFGGDAA